MDIFRHCWNVSLHFTCRFGMFFLNFYLNKRNRKIIIISYNYKFKFPSIMSDETWSWKMFLVSNIALWIGFIVMFLLVIFEDHIKL